MLSRIIHGKGGFGWSVRDIPSEKLRDIEKKNPLSEVTSEYA